MTRDFEKVSAQSFKEEFLRALGGSAGVYLFGTAMSFLVGIQLARGLGVAGYGLYGSAMAAASLGATFASGGLQLNATRDLSAYRALEDHEVAARLVRWSMRNVLVLAAVAALVVGAYVLLALDAAPMLVYSTIALTILMAVLALVGAIVRGAGAVVLGQALDAAIRPAAQSGLLWLAMLALGTIDPTLAITLTFVAILVTLPFGWQAFSRVWRAVGAGRPEQGEQRAWRKASATMGLTTAISIAESTLPLLLVGALSNMEQAGLFRVATAVMVFSNMPATMVTVMVVPMASSLYQRLEIKRLERLSLAAAATIFFPTIAIAGCLWLFGEPLLELAFGSDYRSASTIVAVLAGASVINSLSGMSIGLLHAAHHNAIVTRACGFSLVVTCCCLLYAAIDAQAISFAIAVLIGTGARTVYLIVSVHRFVKIDPTVLGIFRIMRESKDRL